MSRLGSAMQGARTAITATGRRCYIDPAAANNNRPCLLIAPPTLDYVGGTMTDPSVRFRIIALSSYAAGVVESLAELECLIDDVDRALTVERAEPIQYPLGQERVAAYLITTTDYSTEE